MGLVLEKIKLEWKSFHVISQIEFLMQRNIYLKLFGHSFDNKMEQIMLHPFIEAGPCFLATYVVFVEYQANFLVKE